ncbi:hypothetical protein R8871_02530 [Paraburkholderia graminis C4D1M]|uniref:Uncharacterized protein n=1 Tax=Paraburkholderia graminis (strain ATCC 700544 / DSM 17151 / LMG 18924 / NCIMB 13744 / C4D1M) TaxID=396598 RepID=B1G5M9_PARG4|nr:hypothetical protein BgramDRAFT_4633 [Paraburkholderia graminis C4D1M]CAB3681411.1 hypothetical protein R8871_02530 [Paraburkholderia graminis C4D1M]
MNMDAQLYFSNITGATYIDVVTDDKGAPCVIVTGPDHDAVLATALNVKNVLPVEQCPEVGEVLRDLGNGSWCAHVRTRRPL